MSVELELPEIQGNILCAYGLPLTRYCHFRFDDTRDGRAFVAAVTPEVTTAEDRRPDGGSWSEDKPESTVNLAFTFTGLAALGLGAPALAGFPTDFRMGMRARASILVDRGTSAPDQWEPVWQSREVHACVTLYASSAAAMERKAAWLEQCRQAAGRVTMIDVQEAGQLVVDGQRTLKEHFGFTDGFGNPEVAGAGCASRPGRGKVMPGGKWAPIAAGEFILGYRNENEEVALTPEPSQLYRNGSYMVYRKLHENVASFRAYVQREGERYPGGPDHLAAKMIGRWQDGTPLELSPDKPDAALGADEQRHNDFTYGGDPTGARCPMGAHIRRANPRDAQGFGGILTNPHRIVRRGVPYGEWTPADEPGSDEGNHGIIFVAYNASIENQFEFVQQQWMNYGNDFGMGNDKDPVIGSHLDDDIHVIGADGRNPLHICRKLPPFVVTRGGEYFFVPSRTALRLLSDTLASAPRHVDTPVSEPKMNAFDHLFEKLESLARHFPFIGHGLDHEFVKIHDAVEKFAEHVQKEALHADPEPLFAILRRIKPIVHVKNFAIVTRYNDCEDVMNRDDIFAQPYAAKFAQLTGGTNFFLGMSNTPEYTHDVSVMRMVVRREDIPDRVVPFVRDIADALVKASGGRLDVVSGLTSAVPTALVGDYFGTPNPPGGAFATQSAEMSGYLFLPKGGSAEASVAAAKSMREVISQQIVVRHAARGQRDDVLERLLVLQDAKVPGITDAWILDQLFSFVVAAIPTTSAAVARAIDELMRRPAELAAVQEAARAGNIALVGRYVSEATRFSPLGAGVFRTTTAEYTIGAGTAHAVTVPAGTIVLVSLLSAMFDAERIEHPNRFEIDRPAWTNMAFGFGIHTCFGQYINAVQMPLIAAAILKQRNLRRAPGDAGKLQFDGSFPSSMTLEFDP